MTPTICLAMIVKNEEKNLERCLESVRDAVDEIVIVDTGSSDRTVEIAGKFTGSIFHYRWNGDFSAARNYSLDQVKSQWVLYLDADEELDTTGDDLRALIAGSGGLEAYFLPLHNNNDSSPTNYNRYLVLRLFKNTPDYRFQGKIHEQVIIKRPGSVGIAKAPLIWHRHIADREQNRKRKRNLTLLMQEIKKDPENPFLHYYLALEWLGLDKPGRAIPHLRRTYRDLAHQYILFRAPAIRYLVTCLKMTGQIDEAICICLEDSLRYPQYTDLFFEGGILFELKGEYEIASRWFREAINSGPPPALFSHANGTESFLSLYHLGYCSERTGRSGEAEKYYSQAMEANPGYIYPVYNLFILYLERKGPRRTFDLLREAGHLICPERAKALADLFFKAGYPGFAPACLSELMLANPDKYTPPDSLLAKILVYGGKAEEGISYIKRFRERGVHVGPDLSFDEIMALILKREYREARKKSLALWKDPEGRNLAILALNLADISTGRKISVLPEISREPSVIQKALSLLECLWRYRPPFPSGKGAVLHREYLGMAGVVIKFLTLLSPRGCIALEGFIKEKAGGINQLANKKYGPAGGLFQ